MAVQSPHQLRLSLVIGVALVILGVSITVLAAREHAQIIGRLNRGEVFVPPVWSLGLIFSLFLTLIGTAMAFYLLTMM